LPASKHDLQQTEQKIMAKLTELNGILQALGDKLDKATAEIIAAIDALKKALSDVELPADAQASLDRLTAAAQVLDDLNPDVPA
jgi:DNA repair ATPase RecN